MYVIVHAQIANGKSSKPVSCRLCFKRSSKRFGTARTKSNTEHYPRERVGQIGFAPAGAMSRASAEILADAVSFEGKGLDQD